MTAHDIITGALRKLGAIDISRVPETAELADGIEALNDMLEAWSIDRLCVFTIQSAAYQLQADKQSYTIGRDPAGVLTADFDAPRPSRVENANLLIGDLPYALHLATDDEWAARGLRHFGAIPSELYNDGGYPLSTLSLYPYPAGGSGWQLELFSWQALAQFADAASDYYFPPGYARALKSNLALDLACEYTKEPAASLVKLAQDSKAAIENLNIETPSQQCDPALTASRGGRVQYGWLGNYRN